MNQAMPVSETHKLLQRVDADSGAYRWYELQLRTDRNLFETSTVVMAWGRIGQTNGGSMRKTFYSLDSAKSFFQAKLRQRLQRGYQEVGEIEVPNDGNCVLCRLLKEPEKEPRVIHEFPNSILLLNRDQSYQGRSILVFKKHIPDFFRLASSEMLEFLPEIRLSEKALRKAFDPALMNYLFMGNTTAHVHLHLVPRYRTDPNFGRSPFLDTARTMTAQRTPDEYRDLVLAVQRCLIEIARTGKSRLSDSVS